MKNQVQLFRDGSTELAPQNHVQPNKSVKCKKEIEQQVIRTEENPSKIQRKRIKIDSEQITENESKKSISKLETENESKKKSISKEEIRNHSSDSDDDDPNAVMKYMCYKTIRENSDKSVILIQKLLRSCHRGFLIYQVFRTKNDMNQFIAKMKELSLSIHLRASSDIRVKCMLGRYCLSFNYYEETIESFFPEFVQNMKETHRLKVQTALYRKQLASQIPFMLEDIEKSRYIHTNIHPAHIFIEIDEYAKWTNKIKKCVLGGLGNAIPMSKGEILFRTKNQQRIQTQDAIHYKDEELFAAPETYRGVYSQASDSFSLCLIFILLSSPLTYYTQALERFRKIYTDLKNEQLMKSRSTDFADCKTLAVQNLINGMGMEIGLTMKQTSLLRRMVHIDPRQRLHSTELRQFYDEEKNFDICIHQQNEAYCISCKGLQVCEHLKIRTSCIHCARDLYPQFWCSLCKMYMTRTSTCSSCTQYLQSKNQATKESHFKKWIQEKFPKVEFIQNKTIKGPCSSLRRPDFYVDLLTHVLIIELDENAHRSYTCENKRIMEIYCDFGKRPLVAIRFNPDSYTDKFGIMQGSCFLRDKKSNLLVRENIWNERLRKIELLIDEAFSPVPEKAVNSHFLFYDEEPETQKEREERMIFN